MLSRRCDGMVLSPTFPARNREKERILCNQEEGHMNKNLNVIVGSAVVALACTTEVRGTRDVEDGDIVSQYREATAGQLPYQVFKERLSGVLAEHLEALAQCFGNWHSLCEIIRQEVLVKPLNTEQEKQEELNPYVSVLEMGVQNWGKLLKETWSILKLVGQTLPDVENQPSELAEQTERVINVVRLAFQESAAEAQRQSESLRACLELLQHTLDEMQRGSHS